MNLGGDFSTANVGFAGGVLPATAFTRSGGIVNVTGKLTNTGDSMTLNAGTGTWNLGTNGTIIGGTVNVTGTQHLTSGAGTLDGVTVICATATETLDVLAGGTLTVLNDLTVNGTLTMATNTILNFSAASGVNQHLKTTSTALVTLGGSGGGNEARLRQTTSSHTVTFDANVTVKATNTSNTIGYVSGGFSGTWANAGTFTTPAGGSLTLETGSTFSNNTAGAVWETTGGTFTLNPSTTWSNIGTIRIVTAGVLNLGGNVTTANIGLVTRTHDINNIPQGTINLTGNINNVGATFTMDQNVNGSWFFGNFATITGGTIETLNGSGFTQNGAFTFDGVTISTGSLVLLTGSGSYGLTVKNGLTINGTVMIGNAAGTFYAFLSASGSQTIGGTGDILFGGNAASALTTTASGQTLTLGPSLLIHGKSGTIGTGGSTFAFQGPLKADVSGGTLRVGQGSNTLSIACTISTAGATQAINGGTMFIAPSAGGTPTWTNTGIVTVGTGQAPWSSPPLPGRAAGRSTSQTALVASAAQARWTRPARSR